MAADWCLSTQQVFRHLCSRKRCTRGAKATIIMKVRRMSRPAQVQVTLTRLAHHPTPIRLHTWTRREHRLTLTYPTPRRTSAEVTGNSFRLLLAVGIVACQPSTTRPAITP